MRLIRLTAEYITRIIADHTHLCPGEVTGCALSLGSFDGLHRGHQRLIEQVTEARYRQRLSSSCLFTFRRHPRLVLDPEAEPFLLTTWREKLSLLEESQIDVVIAADFCPALAQLPYDEFVERFLVDLLGMKHLVAGYDVHLGAGRGGTAATLTELGHRLGYRFEVVPALAEADSVISSSAVRRALADGDCDFATASLGRPYAVWGEVGPGDGRGRTIGFPTANVTPLDRWKLLPQAGVYAVRIQVPGDVGGAGMTGGHPPSVVECLPEVDRSGDILSAARSQWMIFDGMLNFGKVPTFHGDGLEAPRIEVNIFDFAGDLRGRTVKVEWIRRLRGERKFDSAEALVAQLNDDRKAAKEVLAVS